MMKKGVLLIFITDTHGNKVGPVVHFASKQPNGVQMLEKEEHVEKLNPRTRRLKEMLPQIDFL